MPSPPPHSGDHKSRLFAWILDVQRSAAQARRPKPFMLLLPAWTSKWLPWRTFLWALARLRKGSLEVAPLIGRVAIPPLPPVSLAHLSSNICCFRFPWTMLLLV
jgi:hypothetical protein